MTENELKECFAVFNDFWKMLRANSDLDHADWNKIISAASAVSKTHGNSTFAKNVEYAILSVLTEKEREKKKARANAPE